MSAHDLPVASPKGIGRLRSMFESRGRWLARMAAADEKAAAAPDRAAPAPCGPSSGDDTSPRVDHPHA